MSDIESQPECGELYCSHPQRYLLVINVSVYAHFKFVFFRTYATIDEYKIDLLLHQGRIDAVSLKTWPKFKSELNLQKVDLNGI